MDSASSREWGRLPSDKVRAAIENGDLSGALALCDELPKEYVLMHKGLRVVVELLLTYNEQLFRREQATTSEQIKSALARGDADEGLALLERKRRQHLDVHDIDLAFMASTFSWLYTAFGDQALYDCQRYLAEAQRRGFENWEALSPADFARATAFLLSLHADGRVAVEEDEEKFSVICDPCGTGGKMQRDGLFDAPNARYARVAKPQPMTFDQPDFPTYCTHCAVWNSIGPVEWFGHPQWVHVPMREAGDPCVVRIYKNPRDIPAGYYHLVGKEKPEA